MKKAELLDNIALMRTNVELKTGAQSPSSTK